MNSKIAGLLLLALLCSPVAAVEATSYQSAKIIVQVQDQSGLAYSGVTVTIFSSTGSNTSTGTTVNGVFISVPLLINSNYTVLVNSGFQSKNQTVVLGVTDTLVKFVLNRPAPVRPRIVISSVDYSPANVRPGTLFTAIVNLNNTGVGTAYAATVRVVPGKGVNLVGGTGTDSVGTLAQNQAGSVKYTMEANANLSSGFIPVGVSFSYTDINSISYNDSTTFNIQILSRPDVRVGAFGLSVAPLRPGISSVLSLSLINVGGDRAYGVSVTVSGSTFLSGSPTNYLGSIAAGNSATASFYLSVLNNTATGAYPLSLTINYTDVNGNPFSASSQYVMSVEPYLPPSVTVTNVLLDPPVLTIGSTGTITLFLSNQGSTAATNVDVTIEGGSGLVASDYFGLGTMGPGAQVTQVVGLNVEPGVQTAPRNLLIKVYYSDLNGNNYSTTVPYEAQIYPAVNPFSLSNILVVAGLVLLALVVIIMVRRYNLLQPLTRSMSQ